MATPEGKPHGPEQPPQPLLQPTAPALLQRGAGGTAALRSPGLESIRLSQEPQTSALREKYGGNKGEALEQSPTFHRGHQNQGARKGTPT